MAARGADTRQVHRETVGPGAEQGKAPARDQEEWHAPWLVFRQLTPSKKQTVRAAACLLHGLLLLSRVGLVSLLLLGNAHSLPGAPSCLRVLPTHAQAPVGAQPPVVADLLQALQVVAQGRVDLRRCQLRSASGTEQISL